MTQKDTVIIDLSARIPYDTWVQIEIYTEHRDRGNYFHTVATSDILLDGYTLDDYSGSDVKSIKAYLRPMSSMTEEEEKEYIELGSKIGFPYRHASNLIDWLNKHHFDYRELIPKGMALEAPEGMYN